MKIALSVLLAVILTGLTGCLPVSENPLSKPEDGAADSRLTGVWYGKSGDDTVFLHFVPDHGAKVDIAEVDHEQKGGAATNLYTAFPSKIGSNRYLNIQDKKGTSKSYYLARYQISSSGTLTVWLMSEKPAAKAIRSGKLTGKVNEKESSSGKTDLDISITSSTAQLASFVAKADPETLFAEKFGTFKKLALPSAAGTPAPAPASSPKSSPKAKKRSN